MKAKSLSCPAEEAVDFLKSVRQKDGRVCFQTILGSGRASAGVVHAGSRLRLEPGSMVAWQW